MSTRWNSIAVVALVGLGLSAAGCGGKAAAPGVANLGTTTASAQAGTATPTSKESGARAFASCMRSHGVPNFPDPGSGGGISIGSGSGIDPSSPQFQSAQRACQNLLPAGKAASPALQAKAQAAALKFSSCMRSHGVPNFPDPQFSGNAIRLAIRPGSGIDPQSPQFQQAQSSCMQYMPGGGKGLRTQSGPVGPGGGGKVTSGSAGGP